jgi:L-alanine-DL-glutamate epimerase-like enolase superfamily enzyme
VSHTKVERQPWWQVDLERGRRIGHVVVVNRTDCCVGRLANFDVLVSAGRAAGIIQVDVARIGGITPWLKVAHLGETYNVVVRPHFLMELHVSLCCAVPNGAYLEHIPQLRAITHGEIKVVDGLAVPPAQAGLGIDWDRDAIDDRRVR